MLEEANLEGLLLGPLLSLGLQEEKCHGDEVVWSN